MKKHIYLKRNCRCKEDVTEYEKKSPRKSLPKKEVISVMIDVYLYELFHECLSYDETTKTEVMTDWIEAYVKDHPALEDDDEQEEDFDDEIEDDFDDEDDDYESVGFRKVNLPAPKDFISSWVREVNSFLNNEVTRIYYDAHIKVPEKIRSDIEDGIDLLYSVIQKIYKQDQENSRANDYEDEEYDVRRKLMGIH